MKSRIVVFDYIKALSVLALAPVHALWMYGAEDVAQTSYLGAILQLCGQGAAFFVVPMGVAFVIASPKTLAQRVHRGMHLLLLGYLLNILKFWVPNILDVWPDSIIGAYGWEKPLSADNWLHLLGTGDILQFAGVATMVVGLVEWLLPKRAEIMLLLAVVVAGLTHIVRGLHPGVYGLDYVADLVWGVGWNVYFPIFPWISIVFLGMAFGYWIKDDFLRIRILSLGFGTSLMAIGALLIGFDRESHLGDFFHMGAGGVMVCAGIVFLTVGILDMMIGGPYGSRIPRVVTYGAFWLSRNVTKIYILQWVIICWGIGAVGFRTLAIGDVMTASLVVGFLMTTYFVAEAIWRRSRRAALSR